MKRILMLAGMLTPLGPFRYVTNMASVECVKCPTLHTPFLDRFKCANHTPHFRTLVMHSKYYLLLVQKHAI